MRAAARLHPGAGGQRVDRRARRRRATTWRCASGSSGSADEARADARALPRRAPARTRARPTWPISSATSTRPRAVARRGAAGVRAGAAPRARVRRSRSSCGYRIGPRPRAARATPTARSGPTSWPPPRPTGATRSASRRVARCAALYEKRRETIEGPRRLPRHRRATPRTAELVAAATGRVAQLEAGRAAPLGRRPPRSKERSTMFENFDWTRRHARQPRDDHHPRSAAC